jgi:hypothetical protein
MRQPHTFLLTVLLDDHDATTLRGRVRFIASEEETSFVGIDELIRFMRTQVERYDEALGRDIPPAQHRSPQEHR